MGVRFQCPQGHKLHVKAELAGKRGICPECGARFIVPNFSGERVEEAPPASATPSSSNPTSGPTESVLIHTQPDPRGTSPSAVTAGVEPVAWYIRPSSGGQFGPATTEVFRQWVDEGRVAADSWVWRTGWPDWKAGREALLLVADAPPLEPVAAMARTLDPLLDAELNSPSGQVEAGTAEARRAEIRRRKQRVRTVSMILGLVALATLVVLIIVLAR